jgi:hypothetical protein
MPDRFLEGLNSIAPSFRLQCCRGIVVRAESGGAMTHVSLDSQDENVKQFVLSLTADPDGSLVELNGQAVACVVPPPRPNGTTEANNWTDEKNARRVALIERKFAGGLAPSEHGELAELQGEMLRFRRKVAPLPLDAARRLHQDLLARAAVQNSPKWTLRLQTRND